MTKRKLIYGHRYRATIELSPVLRSLVTADAIVSELAPYQLRNACVRQTESGYVVEADYLGVTGAYDLPAEVRAVEVVGQAIKLRA